MMYRTRLKPLLDADGGGAGSGGTENPPAAQPDANKSTDPPLAEPVPAINMEELLEKMTGQIQMAADDAVKRAGMSPEEKEKSEQAKRLEDLDKREKTIALRELKSDAASMLAAKKLPAEALDIVLGADKAATEKNIEAFVKMFDAAVQKQVETRLVGTTPPAGDDVPGGGVVSLAGALAEHYQKRGN